MKSAEEIDPIECNYEWEYLENYQLTSVMSLYTYLPLRKTSHDIYSCYHASFRSSIDSSGPHSILMNLWGISKTMYTIVVAPLAIRTC